ncbi:hypothetical protein GFC01_17475 [Desulfofundulus thermobenzoicus]|uniref:Uncharacterized protein n=1 Tax=Desulfofundulus thermobenzoicus TaxID=29376 RepID=A0A6N7IVT1_9FIRM|nr:hypothetical protein [Desulfofundulus thermobenzoicus]MQL54011.1 hypothetical protein [Desulfofundulus thermobenzoicus]
MPVVPLSPREFQEKTALCWRCANATGADCPYFSIKDHLVGLEAVGAVAYMVEIEDRPSFKVVRCPHFREGPLRPLSEQALLAVAFL